MAQRPEFPGFTHVSQVEYPTYRTLQRWEKTGRIQFHEFGRLKYVKDDDLRPKPVAKTERVNGRGRKRRAVQK